MKYNDLVKGISNFEDSFWFAEYVYFKALEKLEPVRADLSKLETKEHVKGIIKIFLIQWGMMGRTVNKRDLDWEQLGKQLRNSKEAFQKLQGKSLLDIDLDDVEVRDNIKRTYDAVRIKYIGATAISKILHLLNPEIYVIWDEDIRKKYKVVESAEGYFDFLKQMKAEVEEALEEEAKKKKRVVKRKLQRKFVGSFRVRNLVKDMIEKLWLNSLTNTTGG